MNQAPKISVIIPCRNEAKFIRKCLESVLQNEYPRDRLEVLVVDGMSEDGTWEIIDEYSGQYPCVRRLRNFKQITPAALNLGIRSSVGQIIFRVDAHAVVAPDYLRLGVETLMSSAADNVGGAMETVPQKPGMIAKAIAGCISHPFGVGNSAFRISRQRPTFTDTVFGGCYRKEIFEQIGPFNELLPRGQDMEFNCRLRGAGGKILLDPRLKSSYCASSDLKTFWDHNFCDGEWAILPFAYSQVIPVRWRHMVPLATLSSALVLAAWGAWRPSLLECLLGLAAVYFLMSLLFAAQIAVRERNLRFLFAMPLAFGIRHLAYGCGSVLGVLRLIYLNCSSRFPASHDCSSSR